MRWAEVNPTGPAVVQSGTLAIAERSILYGNLAVNTHNDMAVGFGVSGPGYWPSQMVAGRLAGDAPGTLRSPVVVRAGDLPYRSFENSPVVRWGDYSAAVPDPDGNTIWYVGQYAKGGMPEPYDYASKKGNWGTHVVQVGFGAPDKLFSDNFGRDPASMSVHTLINQEEADSAPGATVLQFDEFRVRYVVRNTGKQSLSGINVVDTTLGAAVCQGAGALAPGESRVCSSAVQTSGSAGATYTANYTAVADDGTVLQASNAAVLQPGFNPVPGTRCTQAGGIGCPQALADAQGACEVGGPGERSVTSTMSISGCANITKARVGLNINHTYVGDMVIKLRGPTGVERRLFFCAERRQQQLRAGQRPHGAR